MKLRALNLPFELCVFEGDRHDAARYAQLDTSKKILSHLFDFVRTVT